MSAPKESDDGLIEHLVYYSQRMSDILNLDQQASSAQLAAIDDYEGEITKFQHFIDDIMTNLNVIKMPANILFGGKDAPSYETSAHFIYEHLGSVDKRIKWSEGFASFNDAWRRQRYFRRKCYSLFQCFNIIEDFKN